MNKRINERVSERINKCTVLDSLCMQVSLSVPQLGTSKDNSQIAYGWILYPMSEYSCKEVENPQVIT